MENKFNTLDLFQNFNAPEEVTFDPEVDLNDDAIGISRYERSYYSAQA